MQSPIFDNVLQQVDKPNKSTFESYGDVKQQNNYVFQTSIFCSP